MTNTWPGWQNAGLIGEGSFGKVYRIQREEFGQKYEAALKVITIPASEAEVQAAYAEGMDQRSVTQYFHGFVEDIVAEFALMSGLKGNSNVVSYEDHMVVEHQEGIGWDILIRMELLTALTEYEVIRPLTESDVIRLGKDMAHALELCRRRGIIHRDIKPENIFVSKDGDFKLGDFGVARVAEKTVSAMSRKGTYNYMAPEVYKGEEYGYGADLYSLGIVLYRCLNNNRAPFLPPYPQTIQYSDREQALNRRMAGQQLPPPAKGSPRLQEIVLKACAYRPEDRFSDSSKLGAALAALLSEPGSAAGTRETAGPDGFGSERTAQAGAFGYEGTAGTGGFGSERTVQAGAFGYEGTAGTRGFGSERTAQAGAFGYEGTAGTGGFGSERTAQAGAFGYEGTAEPGAREYENGDESDWEKTLSAFSGDRRTEEKSAFQKKQPEGSGQMFPHAKVPWYQRGAVGASILLLLLLIEEVTFRFNSGTKADDLIFGLVNWLHPSYSDLGVYHSVSAVGFLHGMIMTWVLLLLMAAGAYFWEKMWRESVGKRVGIGIAFLLFIVLFLFLRIGIHEVVGAEYSRNSMILGIVTMFGLDCWRRKKRGEDGKAALWRRVAVCLTVQAVFLGIFFLGTIKIVVEINGLERYGEDWRRAVNMAEHMELIMQTVRTVCINEYNLMSIVLMIFSLTAAIIIGRKYKEAG